MQMRKMNAFGVKDLLDSMKVDEGVTFITEYGVEVRIFKCDFHDYTVWINGCITIHCNGFRIEDWDEIEILMGFHSEMYMECKEWRRVKE